MIPVRRMLLCAVFVLLSVPPTVAVELAVEPYVFEAGGQKTDAELGRFSVPENRSVEGSRQIELKFVRFKSTAAKPGTPIVYLAGARGAAARPLAEARAFHSFRRYGQWPT